MGVLIIMTTKQIREAARRVAARQYAMADMHAAIENMDRLLSGVADRKVESGEWTPAEAKEMMEWGRTVVVKHELHG